MRKLVPMQTLVVLALLLSGCAQNLIVQGRKLADKGEYDRAIELFYQEIAADPQHADDAWRELGIAFYKSGDLIKAEDALKKGGKADPATHLYLGLVFEARGEYGKAVDAYTATLRLHPRGKTETLVRTHLDGVIRRQFDQEISHAIKNEASIDADSIPPNTVAVVSFDGSHLSTETAPIARGLADLTSADLSKVGSLRLVERLKIGILLEELKLAASAYVEDSLAPRLGRLLGSSHIVTGSALSIGEDRIRLDGAVINTLDSTSSLADPSEGELKRFFRIQKDFVFKVIDDLGVRLTATERDAIRKVPTESYLAFMAYCRGLDYRGRGMLNAAQKEFEQALEYDSDFGEARQEFQSVVSTLSARELGEVTAADLEASIMSDVRASEQGNDVRLTTVVTNLGVIPSGTSESSSTADSDPDVGGTGGVIVRGNLDGN